MGGHLNPTLCKRYVLFVILQIKESTYYLYFSDVCIKFLLRKMCLGQKTINKMEFIKEDNKNLSIITDSDTILRQGQS